MPKKSNTKTITKASATSTPTVPSKKTAATKKVATKKVVSPKAVKKSAVKKGKKTLVTAKGSDCFWTHDGLILTNIIELHAAVKAMKTPVFTHHVTKYKNDFADWTEYILKDSACASQLRSVTAKKATVDILSKSSNTYST